MLVVVTGANVRGEIAELAARADRGFRASRYFGTAVWLNGRPNQMSADCYMIYECAEKEFNGSNGIRDALGLSAKSQSDLTKSANHLALLAGGRHAGGNGQFAVMALDEQLDYIARLLRLWIGSFIG